MSKLIRSPQEALEVLDDYHRLKPSVVAVDTETTGLYWPADSMFLAQVGWGWNANYAFPTEYLRYVSPIIEDPDSEKVLHNAKFDMHFLERAGMEMKGRIHDTQVMARLLLPQNHRGQRISIALGELAIMLIDNDAQDSELALKAWMKQEKSRRSKELTKRLREVGVFRKQYNEWVKAGAPLPPEVRELVDSMELEPTYADVPHEIMEPYATDDVKYTLALFHKFWPMIQSNGLIPAYERDMQVMMHAYRWEKTGMRVDQTYLKQGIEHGEAEIARIQQQIEQEAGKINLNSWQQIIAMFEKRGIHLEDTQSETLEAVKEQDPLAELILQYRGYSKEVGTYFKPIYEKSLVSSGRIHGTFNVAGPITGRFSSSDPNLQNMTRDEVDDRLGIRRAFIPSEGRALVFMDYSQMEVRMMAEYSQDENLIAAILNKEDLHTKTALTIDPKARELYDPSVAKDGQSPEFKKLRQAAKETTFGIFYGMGAKTLASNLKVDYATARMYIDNFFKLYPGVNRFMRAVQNVAMSRPGHYVVNKFGRVYWGEPGYEYKLVDYLIQGSCADLMKIAIDRCEKLLKGKKSRLISMVHDELIFECVPEEVSLIPQLREQMTYWPDLQMPMDVEIEYSFTNWADAKPWQGETHFLQEYRSGIHASTA